jgi:hypothetical protein
MNPYITEISFFLQSVGLKLVLLHNPWSYVEVVADNVYSQVDECSFGSIFCSAVEGQGILIIQASRSHSDKPHSVELLWKSDQPDAETST